jgi:hypothetical protein
MAEERVGHEFLTSGVKVGSNYLIMFHHLYNLRPTSPPTHIRLSTRFSRGIFNSKELKASVFSTLQDVMARCDVLVTPKAFKPSTHAACLSGLKALVEGDDTGGIMAKPWESEHGLSLEKVRPRSATPHWYMGMPQASRGAVASVRLADAVSYV